MPTGLFTFLDFCSFLPPLCSPQSPWFEFEVTGTHGHCYSECSQPGETLSFWSQRITCWKTLAPSFRLQYAVQSEQSSKKWIPYSFGSPGAGLQYPHFFSKLTVYEELDAYSLFGQLDGERPSLQQMTINSPDWKSMEDRKIALCLAKPEFT